MQIGKRISYNKRTCLFLVLIPFFFPFHFSFSQSETNLGFSKNEDTAVGFFSLALLNEGRGYIELGLILNDFLHARDKAREEKNLAIEVRSEIKIGDIHKSKGRIEEALRHYGNAEDRIKKIDNVYKNLFFKSEVYNSIGRVYEEQGLYSKAVENYKSGVEIIEKYLGLKNGDEEKKSNILKFEKNCYSGIVTSLIEQGSIKNAYEYFSQYKARLLNEIIKYEITNAYETSLSDSSNLVKTNVVDLIQKDIDSLTLLIDYFIDGEEKLVYAFICTREKFKVYKLGHANFLHQKIYSLKREQNTVERKMMIGYEYPILQLLKMNQSLRSLSDHLLAPIKNEEWFKNKLNVIIIPDERLFNLPFEVLFEYNRKDSSSYPKRVNINYHPSPVSYLNNLKYDKKKSGLVVVANSKFSDASKLKIPDTSKLIRYVPNVKLVKDAQVTFESIKRFDFENYPFLYLSTHFVLNENDPLSSFFKLFDSQLSLRQVSGFKLSSELIILSACNTGKGEFKRGSSLIGCMYSFMEAGAKSLIMSLWKVDEIPSEQLLIFFFENLSKGQTISEAFSKAKWSLRNWKNKRYDHPFYWGAFVLFGGKY